MSESQFVTWLDEEDRPQKPTLWTREDLAAAFQWRLPEELSAYVHAYTSLTKTPEWNPGGTLEHLLAASCVAYTTLITLDLRGMSLESALTAASCFRLAVSGDAIVVSGASGQMPSVLDVRRTRAETYEVDDPDVISASHGRKMRAFATVMRRVAHHTSRRRPSPLTELYQTRITKYETQLDEQSVAKQLRETSQKYKLLSALMEDDWLGLQLLSAVGDAAGGMTMTQIVKEVDREADRVAPMLAALLRYGVIETAGTHFAATRKGSVILENLAAFLGTPQK